MTKYAGYLGLIKIDISATPTTIGGIRNVTLTINNEQIDVTDQQSSNRFRELIAGGIRSWSVSFEGLVSDDTAFKAMAADALDGSFEDYTIVFGYGTYSGSAQVASFEPGANHENEAQLFSATIEGTGTLSFA